MNINCKINIDKWEEEFYNDINRSNIKIFTYEDYIKYQKFLNEKHSKNNVKKSNDNDSNYNNHSIYDNCKDDNYNEINSVMEDSAPYIRTSETLNKKVNNEHDKIFRKILDVKSEAANFINKTLKLKNKITGDQLEKYNSSFVSEDLRNQESDIVYKLKGRNIFFLIEHQTRIDYTMPVRILDYTTAIIKSAIDYKKFGQKGYKIPRAIPIVLYTGKKKWDAKTYIKDMQEEFEDFNEKEFAKYNVVDTNNITEEKLLEEKNYLSKVILLEKYDGNDLSEYLDKIILEIDNNQKYYDNEGKEVLIILIEQILITKIGEEKAKEVIKKLKGGNGKMLNCVKSAYRENRAIFNNGMKTGLLKERTEIVKNMLKEKLPIDLISRITGISQEEIKNIK